MAEQLETKQNLYVATVVDTSDTTGGERIRVRITGVDDKITSNMDDRLYAFPLLPKMIHVKPKVSEMVLVITSVADANAQSQRYYLGPIISQPYDMYKSYPESAMRLIGGLQKRDANVRNFSKAFGCFANDGKSSNGEGGEVAIYSRQNSDIILGDNDLKIRCGARLLRKDTNTISFNRDNPSFIKLQYFQQPLSITLNRGGQAVLKHEVGSATTISGQFINLFSTAEGMRIDTTDEDSSDNMFTDENLKKMMENSHPVVRGDNLCELLSDLIQMFLNHTHKYNGLKVTHGPSVDAFLAKYSTGQGGIEDKIVNQHIRVD